jgi:hypothetical protein
VHRRTLPIAEPCQVFRPTPGHTFCSQCEKHVHDISAMTKREATRFLAANAGKTICIAYRARRDGSIVVRPDPRAVGVVSIALGLAACAGHAPETERPGDECRDESGYVIDCELAARTDGVVLPDEVPVDRSEVDPKRSEPVHADVATEFDFDEGSRDVVGELMPRTGDSETDDPKPISTSHHEFEQEAGVIVIDEKMQRRLARDDRRAKREELREARRERRAARGG